MGGGGGAGLNEPRITLDFLVEGHGASRTRSQETQ